VGTGKVKSINEEEKAWMTVTGERYKNKWNAQLNSTVSHTTSVDNIKQSTDNHVGKMWSPLALNAVKIYH